MESIIWALDLFAVAYLCLWALRTDKAEAASDVEVDPVKPQGPTNA